MFMIALPHQVTEDSVYLSKVGSLNHKATDILGGWPNVRIILLMAFFVTSSSSMLIHLYIGWALAYGWMTCLLLLHKGILGHFMQKITKKVCFLGFPSRKFIFRDRNSKLATNVFKRMLLIKEHVALV